MKNLLSVEWVTNVFLYLGLLFGSILASHHRTLDLVEVTAINPHIRLDIRYATENNFTHQAVYRLAKCYLRRGAAEKLNKVQKELEKQGLGLKVFDGYRPLSVQKDFWRLLPDERYVANPAKNKGSKHNRGAAVDLTLIDVKTGQELEMPSGFDDFSTKAHRTYETMTVAQAAHCRLLEDTMKKYGFDPYQEEWWHFNDRDWKNYKVLDVSFEELEKMD